MLGLAAALAWVGAYRVIDPPPGPYMRAERARLGTIAQDWQRIEAISPHLVRAAIAAEDARFCAHFGLDLDAIRAARAANAAGGRLRGASTITQQVAKNVFLWPERSYLRKALEAGLALMIEGLWPKRRIVEVYLNVAEFAPGVFGAEAAARHHFGRSASRLTAAQAARLAAVLPAPKSRSAGNPGRATARRARDIAAGAALIERTGQADCVLDGP